jgi:hypothetical protein
MQLATTVSSLVNLATLGPLMKQQYGEIRDCDISQEFPDPITIKTKMFIPSIKNLWGLWINPIEILLVVNKAVMHGLVNDSEEELLAIGDPEKLKLAMSALTGHSLQKEIITKT